MKSVLAFVLGAVIAAGAVYLWANRELESTTASLTAARAQLAAAQKAGAASLAAAKAKPPFSTITLTSGGPNGECNGAVGHDPMSQRKRGLVAWALDWAGCNPPGNWVVEVEFTNPAAFPLAAQLVSGHRNSPVIVGQVQTTASLPSYTYKVWMRGHTGHERYLLVDPELEVEDNQPMVPPATQPNPPGGN
ncbi:MAG: hypothetical protein A3J29_00300 [Acidobacteria bacterium RIFCSPLOWO2_12_FULL_67_14b]|nr:MAG: hypothetical protein A3J29_00300 [Acidobacteria bacterium RIFCSPLOWO2_12_FULL_67_14b]